MITTVLGVIALMPVRKVSPQFFLLLRANQTLTPGNWGGRQLKSLHPFCANCWPILASALAATANPASAQDAGPVIAGALGGFAAGAIIGSTIGYGGYYGRPKAATHESPKK